jgi:hypothetical protein
VCVSVCVGEGKYRGQLNLLKPTGYLKHQPVSHSATVRSAHSVSMCFAFILKPTATLALYNTNRLVFITEMKIVYCA